LETDFFADLKGPADFYIIRHGQSEGNAAEILQGKCEFPLSAKGRAQAAERGRSIKEVLAANNESRRALLLSSPLVRARETAEIIAGEAGLPDPIFVDDLAEMELGVWSGKNWKQVQAEDRELWEKFMARSWDAIPGAESSAELYKRALRAWTVLRARALEQGGGKIFAISHGGLIQWLLKATFNCQSWFPLFPTANCGLFELGVEPRGAEKAAYMVWKKINGTL
jgi:broad specificity phosphatase PhoE